MNRFFVSKEAIGESTIEISGDDSLHISKVLRLRPGDLIIACDGNETEYICSIDNIDKKSVICKIIEKKMSASEPGLKVTLFQGMPKASKMDLIIQKCTEIGIDGIIPIDTERVVVKLNEDKNYSNKISRWRKIAEEASKQSGRGRIPKIFDPVNYDDALKMLIEYDICLIPYEKENNVSLKQVLSGNNNFKNVAVIIGPEGGFSEEEIKKAVKYGAVPVSLGRRILRTETAGFVCLSILMYECGELE